MIWDVEEAQQPCACCGHSFEGLHNDPASENVMEYVRSRGLELPDVVCTSCVNKRYGDFSRERREKHLASCAARPYSCSKCGYDWHKKSEIYVVDSTFGRFINFQGQKFQTVTCEACGYTELYSRETSTAANVIDLLFGR